MKRTKGLLAVSCLWLVFCFNNTLNAQGIVLYGTCHDGGTIFKYDVNSNNIKVVYEFDSLDGAGPIGRLLLGNDGKIYGVTISGYTIYSNGNSYIIYVEGGVLFKFDPIAGQYARQYVFDTTISPIAGLAQQGNKLYGMATKFVYATEVAYGVIYSYDIVADTFSVEYAFDTSTLTGSGSQPHGDLTTFNNKLYGVTLTGGAHGDGVIFQYDLANDTYSKVYDFDTINGYSPTGKLTVASNGKLYCLTSQGGANQNGTILEYDPGSGAVTKKYDFSEYLTATGSLLAASDGNLYGFLDSIITGNSGLIYQYIPGGNSIYFECFMSTDVIPNGPAANLMQASNGLLYCADTTVFSFDYNTQTYTQLAQFNQNIGTDPFDGLLEVDSITLGVQSVHQVSNLALFPNPATNEVIIQNVGLGNITSLRLMDMNGRIEQTNYSIQTGKVILDVNDLAPGIYMVQLNGDNSSYTGRFIKVD